VPSLSFATGERREFDGRGKLIKIITAVITVNGISYRADMPDTATAMKVTVDNARTVRLITKADGL
jgi:hypothetical protein